MKKSILPTIIGMNPPTKEVLIVPNYKEKCIDMYICHADFPKGTQKGEYKSHNFDEVTGVADWIRFVDTESMEMFGKDIIKFAKKYSRITEGRSDGMKECCGKCKYNKRDYSKPQNEGYIEFCCGNEDSDEYGVPTLYDDVCDEFEGKE